MRQLIMRYSKTQIGSRVHKLLSFDSRPAAHVFCRLAHHSVVVKR